MTPHEWYVLVCFLGVVLCFVGTVWLGILTQRDARKVARIQKRLNGTKD